jgi:hypothetical protein
MLDKVHIIQISNKVILGYVILLVIVIVTSVFGIYVSNSIKQVEADANEWHDVYIENRKSYLECELGLVEAARSKSSWEEVRSMYLKKENINAINDELRSLYDKTSK